MSNLSNQQFGEDFVLVHRGVRDVHHPDVIGAERGLGTHWSSREEVARGFAEPGSRYPHFSNVQEDDPEELKSTVLSAYVHKNDVMSQDEVQDWNKTKNPLFHYIHTEKDGNHEQEVSVRPGAPVHVVKATDLTNIDDNGRWYEDSERETEFEKPQTKHA